jgi:hypothetical protein
MCPFPLALLSNVDSPGATLDPEPKRSLIGCEVVEAVVAAQASVLYIVAKCRAREKLNCTLGVGETLRRLVSLEAVRGT